LADPKEEGRLGTGGIEPPPNAELPLEKREPKPADTRREGEAMVAYPSRILPFDEREVSLGACWCNVFMSGMDFLTRRELTVVVGLIGER
jgi:hypothetical protein